MKMLLFADDVPLVGFDDYEPLARTLPRRCCRCSETGRVYHCASHPDEHGIEHRQPACNDTDLAWCGACSGNGWSYPDMPDWFSNDGGQRTYWKHTLNTVWRAMGITDDAG